MDDLKDRISGRQMITKIKNKKPKKPKKPEKTENRGGSEI